MKLGVQRGAGLHARANTQREGRDSLVELRHEERVSLVEHDGSARLCGVREVLERGDVQFFFRPMVQAAEAETYTLGVQSFFLILSPVRGLHRRVRIGKKRMPARRGERFWARVERVGTMQRVLGGALEAETYSTKTRGERHQPAARPIAQGTYEIVQHDDHVHFRWEAEPFGFEDAPDEIGLADCGDHLVLFKNDREGRAVWTQKPRMADLDEEGAQIVIVGPSSSDSSEVAEENGGDGRDPDGTGMTAAAG